MPTKFAENVTEKIKRLLEDNMGSGQIKNYRYGDIEFIAQSSLPVCLVTETRTEITVENTAQLLLRHFITITVIINKKTEFNKNPGEQVGKRMLENLVAGVDLTTKELSDESIMGIMSQNFTLESFATNQNADVEYISIAARGKDTITQEVDVNLIIDEIIGVTRS